MPCKHLCDVNNGRRGSSLLLAPNVCPQNEISDQRLRENGISLVSCTYYPLRCFIHAPQICLCLMLSPNVVFVCVHGRLPLLKWNFHIMLCCALDEQFNINYLSACECSKSGALNLFSQRNRCSSC